MRDDMSRTILLAKTQFGLPLTSRTLVPSTYLKELELHLQIHPEDTNFRITAQPERGYGQLICLEKGCERVPIDLKRNHKLTDGGLLEGVGSLSEYGRHIEQHATHKRARLERVKAERNLSRMESSKATPVHRPTPSTINKSEPSGSNTSAILFSSPASSSELTPLESARRRLGRSQCSRNEPSVFNSAPASSPVASKFNSLSQPTQPEVHSSSQKRPADSAVVFEPGAVTLPKKLKRDGTLKAPLGLVNNNITASLSGAPAEPELPGVDHSDTREHIDELQRQISHKQSLLDNLLRKKRPSKQDLTRIENYKAEISGLRLSRDKFKASLPSVSPLKKSYPAPNRSTATLDLLRHRPAVTSSRTFGTPAAPSRYSYQEAGLSKSSIRYRRLLEKHFGVAGPLDVKTEPGTLEPSNDFSHPVAGPSNSGPSSSGPVVNNPAEDVLSQIDEVENENYRLKPRYSDDLGAANMMVQRCQDRLPAIAPINHDNLDDDGTFYGRGRDTFQGPIAKADDIDKFLIEAGNAEIFDGTASVGQAVERLGLPSLYTPLAGMSVALMPHQVIGVAWMVDKENSTLKGGCLGDDMGLGKTVQAIAIMMKNRSADPKRKTTLILAPLALLDQWKLEIELKTDDALKCLIYHGSSKPRKKSQLLEYDVVITTYHTMAHEWPDIENEERKKAKRKSGSDEFIVSDSGSDDYKGKNKRKKHELGLLFQVDFYRIILDEAQIIRNKKTRISRAVTSLNSTIRWCLTGTPIINGLADTYGYLRFLQIRPWYDFKEFHSHIGVYEKKRPDLAVMRLQKVLDTFLLRRKKDTLLDGKRLIELPPKDVVLKKLVFTEEERDIYQMLETQMQTKFTRFLRAGTVLKNYTFVLVLLLRLRQCCSHPSLIQEEGVAFVAPDELDDTGRILKRARDLVSPEFVDKLKAKLKEVVLKRMADERESADAAVEEEDCPICFDTFTKPIVTACGHTFCQACAQELLNAPYVERSNEPVNYKPNERPCPTCRSPIHSELLFERAAFEPTEEDLNGSPSGSIDSDVEMMDLTKQSGGNKGKGKKKARPQRHAKKHQHFGSDEIIDVDAIESSSEYEDDGDDMSDFIVESDEDEEEKDAWRDAKKRLGKRKAFVVLDSDEEIEDERHKVYHGKRDRKSMSAEAMKLLPRFLPSTKMMYMMQHIRKLAEERPDEKVLVISQWTSCLSLVSSYLEENDIIHVKYQGDMSRAHREKAVRAFMSKDKASVMLMSLKCGGVGLNLTRANHVVSLDLGWSQAVEDQAFDRVHRLGQARPVTVERLVIENTVEDRILNLQERKQMLADGSLGEGTGKKIGKLTVKELANLFGLDQHGRRL